MPLLLWGIVTIAFFLSRAVSDNPLATVVGERNLNNPEIVAAAMQRWGLDKNLFEQYGIYIGNLVRGDMGTSFRTKDAVLNDISTRLPATLELAFCALIIAVVVGVALGVVAARTKGRILDGILRVFALIGSSLPVFWVGLVFLFVFYASLGVAPGPGRLTARVKPPPDVTGFYTVDAWPAIPHCSSMPWRT
jgi:peptide/nickel transport system permease protein